MKKLKKWFSKGIGKIEDMVEAEKDEDQLIDDLIKDD